MYNKQNKTYDLYHAKPTHLSKYHNQNKNNFNNKNTFYKQKYKKQYNQDNNYNNSKCSKEEVSGPTEAQIKSLYQN